MLETLRTANRVPIHENLRKVPLRSLTAAFLLLCVMTCPASEDFGFLPYPSATLVETKTSDAVTHLVILGALEKANRELRPERSLIVIGKKSHETYHLPEARRTSQVMSHYLKQLVTRGELAFECDGRSCGSSSYWANKVFDVAVLYGPEQYQKYAIVRLQDDAGYLAAYVGRRATGKIYVHLVRVLEQP